MGIFSFYTVRKPRKFDPKPIYWDPKKEEREERVARIKKEMGVEMTDQEYKPTIKGSFVGATTHVRRRLERGESSDDRSSKSIKLAVVLAVILLLAYYFYFRI